MVDQREVYYSSVEFFAAAIFSFWSMSFERLRVKCNDLLSFASVNQRAVNDGLEVGKLLLLEYSKVVLIAFFTNLD